MSKFFAVIGIIICAVLVIGLPVYFSATPAGRAQWNSWFFKVQKADDATKYETIRKVEDTCRAMIASYESDKLTYEQYKDSKNDQEHSWSEEAKMRANKTASIYNNYILENSFVWEDNVPADIKNRLEIIK